MPQEDRRARCGGVKVLSRNLLRLWPILLLLELVSDWLSFLPTVLLGLVAAVKVVHEYDELQKGRPTPSDKYLWHWI